MNIKQEELAKRLSIKTSLLHQIESGRFVPPIDLARTFEKALHLQLVQEHREKHKPTGKGSTETFTIGDLLRKS